VLDGRNGAVPRSATIQNAIIAEEISLDITVHPNN
jgi:hypothetical protein